MPRITLSFEATDYDYAQLEALAEALKAADRLVAGRPPCIESVASRALREGIKCLRQEWYRKEFVEHDHLLLAVAD